MTTAILERPIDQFDLAVAERFLQTLDPKANAFDFRCIRGRDEPAPNRRGTLKKCADELKKLNIEGYGVYVTVNATDGKGRKNENIVRYRAVYGDFDQEPTKPFPIPPSIKVVTSPGKLHAYWLLYDDMPAETYLAVLRTIVSEYGADPKAKDQARVLRVPGFFHVKGEARMVRLEDANGRRYTSAEIVAAFPPAELPISVRAVDQLPAVTVSDSAMLAEVSNAIERALKKLATTKTQRGSTAISLTYKIWTNLRMAEKDGHDISGLAANAYDQFMSVWDGLGPNDRDNPERIWQSAKLKAPARDKRTVKWPVAASEQFTAIEFPRAISIERVVSPDIEWPYTVKGRAISSDRNARYFLGQRSIGLWSDTFSDQIFLQREGKVKELTDRDVT